MASYNLVVLIGNLTRDPEMRYTPGNTPVVSFGIAVNRTWNDGDGNRQEEVSFFDCECMGGQAQPIANYTKKGSRVLVQGQLRQNRWEDKDGNRRSKVYINAYSVQFLDRAESSSGNGPSASPPSTRTVQPSQPVNVRDDDIPF